MIILGTPINIVILLLFSFIMSIGLPMYFGLKFDWDPSEIDPDIQMDTDQSESPTASDTASDSR